jgi:glycosyltransferase involved in cell wall biosynthesis
MRVLQVIDSLPLAGAEVLVANMAPRLRARGIDCHVAVLRLISSPLEASLREAGVPLEATGPDRIYSLRHVRPLIRMMEGYDLVHVHLFPAQLWAVLAAVKLRPRIPLVTTEHGSSNFRRRWWLRAFDGWMYPHYRIIACNSEATAAELARWCPRIAPRIRMIHNGIPLEDFESAAPVDLPRHPQCTARVIFVGRFDPPKDHATVLRALSEIPAAELVLVGDGPLRPPMEELARTLNMADRVTFLGRRSDIPGLLKASDIFVHSSSFDGFGIAACEAMAAGLPVVASDVPGLSQVVKGAGVLFPAGDHHALARELRALLSSPEKRSRLSGAARERARNFGIERTVDSYIELYELTLREFRREKSAASIPSLQPTTAGKNQEGSTGVSA